MLSEEQIEKRLILLSECLTKAEDKKEDLQGRLKELRLEIANTKGAILELNRLLGDEK